MPGPKRTPKPVLDLRGSWRGKSRADAGHIDGECACPEWVGEYGLECWNYLYPLLKNVDGLMKPAYFLDLAMICDAYNDMRAAMDVISVEGTVAISEKGGKYQHPAVGMKNRARLFLAKMTPRFGLNPADTSKIVSGESLADETDPFAVLVGSN